MRICQNSWRPYKGFNLQNVTKNNGPMSNFVVKTIGSVEITVFQKRECWRSLLFLNRIHLEFLQRQMTTFLARGQRFLTGWCWSMTYQWGTFVALICASKPESSQKRKEKISFGSYIFFGYSGALSRAAKHHGGENLVIYAFNEFWYWENRPDVRTYVHPFM